MMLILLAVVAYIGSMMTHEALGHGIYCLAAGGHTTLLTTWRESCTVSGGRGIKVAGPGVRFVGALCAWLVLLRLPRDASRLRLLVWLYMTFGLLIPSGYVAFSGLTNIGDAAELIDHLPHRLMWRAILVVLGSSLYVGSMHVAATESVRFCGVEAGKRHLFRFIWIPYLAVGCFACCLAALNRTAHNGGALGFAVASSFCACSGMFGLLGIERKTAGEAPVWADPIQWSTTWAVALVSVVAVFAFFIGRGMTWP